MASADSPDPQLPGLAEILETLNKAAGAPADKIDLDSYPPGSDFKVRITPTDEGGTEFFFRRCAVQPVRRPRPLYS